MPEKPPFPARPARQYLFSQDMRKLTIEFQSLRARLSSNIHQMVGD
jgi:hypothetical protein